MLMCAGAAKHDWLQLTGGAIGQGLPVAVGAAVACPDRKVIALQADGSGMYTVQSLWTMARENLDVTTIVLNNGSYAILNIELMRVGVQNPGPKALSMLDLRNPGQVMVTERGKRITGKGFWWHFKRWVRAAGMQYEPSPLPSQQIAEVPIVMVAVPNYDVSDVAMYALRQATARSLGTRPGAQLAVVTVVNTGLFGGSEHKDKSETWLQRQHLAGFRKWADGLDLSGHQVSYHVIESNDVAQALLRYAEGNNVNLIIMGAATHGLSMQRFVATVPIKVAMHAPCTVVLVKEPMPFEQLAASMEEEA